MSGLDLNKLEEKLNNALSNETSESLNNWLEQKRMSNNKQSSVEWLEIELEKLWVKKYLSPITIKPLLEQAKAMHKEEIIDAHGTQYDYSFSQIDPKKVTGEQYYKQTFGGNNEQQ